MPGISRILCIVNPNQSGWTCLTKKKKKQPTSECPWFGVPSVLTQKTYLLISIDLLLFFDTLQCSAACGRGFKNRKVTCVTGSGRPVPEDNCQSLSPKPSKQRRCRGGRCPKWKTGSWGEVGLFDPAIKHSSSTLVLTLPDLVFFPPSLFTLMLTSLLANMCICVRTSATKPDSVYVPCQATNSGRVLFMHHMVVCRVAAQAWGGC